MKTKIEPTNNSQTPESSTSFEKYIKNPKTIILLIVNIVLLLLVSLTLWNYSSNIISPDETNLLDPTISPSAILFTILAYIGSLGAIMYLTITISNRWIRLLLFLLFVITYPLFFGFTAFNLIITVLFYIMFVAFDTVISFDLKLHTKLALFHIYNPRLLLLVTVFSFLLSAQLWVSTYDQPFAPNIEIPSSLIEYTTSFALPVIRDNIQDQLITQIEDQIPLLKDISYDDKALLLEGTITPALRERMYQEGLNDEQINTFATELEKSLNNANLNGLDSGNGSFSVDTVVQQAVNEAEKLLNEVVTTNREYLPWIISLVGFFILNSAGYLLHFLALFITQILLFISQKAGLLKRVEVQTTSEKYVVNSD